jgi:protein ImuB
VLDLAGLDRLFGPPAKLARELKRRVADVGLEANVAVAGNPDAAIHAARGLPGVTVVPQGNEAARLGDLTVDVLFAPNNGGADVEAAEHAAEILETLDRWGVRTFRTLAALPEVALSERLGQEGLRLQKLARGQSARLLVPAEPPLHFEEAMELEHAVDLLEPLAFILGRLLDQICTRLAARALATNELRLTLGLVPPCLRGENVYQRSLRLPQAMLDSKLFLKLLQLELKAHPPGAPVVKVTLAAEPVRPRPPQSRLFLPVSPLPERLELALARLRGVVGEEQVGAAELLDTHRPDAFRMRRFASAEQGLKPSAKKGGSDAGLKPCSTPLMALRVLRPPLLAAVEFCGSRPSRLTTRIREVCGDVIACAGPWRTSGDWWRESAPANAAKKYAWNREEWDLAISNRDGVALYRVYRDLNNGEWLVEGQYD